MLERNTHSRKGTSGVHALSEQNNDGVKLTASGQWHVGLFGHLHLLQEKQVVVRFRTRKAGALLSYLALHLGEAQSREVLTEIIWPGSEPSAARANLRFVLSTLRRDMEPPGVPPGSVLRADNTSVELRSDAVSTDVREFEQLLAAASDNDTDAEQRFQYLQKAVGLYRGDLLLGHYEEWVLGERERLREQYRAALLTLTKSLQERGELETAIRHAATIVSLDNLNEESHVELIRLHLAVGDPASALRQYRKMERIMREEMDDTPSPSSRDLLAVIRKASANRGVAAGNAAANSDKYSEAPTRELEASSDAPQQSVSATRSGSSASSFALPIPLTRFFDRPELTEALEVLRSGRSRLLTVTGAAGSGKTRLIIETARSLKDVFGDAIWFLPAAEYNTAELLADAISDALGQGETPLVNPAEHIAEVLGQQSSLLILDAFEHLAEKGNRVIVDLLQRVPTLTCLVTSRIQLRLAAGAVIPVPPLPVPEQNDSLPQLQSNPSFQLLLDRIRMVRPDFTPTPVNILEMAELCRRLEGLPLSIELAAPWIQVLSPTEILQRLDDPFSLLVSDSSDVPGRHRSLHDAIQSSYDLLTPEMQAFFLRLSVFEGGFTIDVVSAVLEEPKAPLYMRQLREYSLLHVAERGQKTYFYLLDVVRTFSWALLKEEERNSLTQRHAEYYLYLGFEAESHMGGGAREEWLEELEFRIPNFRRALDWYSRQDPAQYLFLVSSLWLFWYLRSHINEGQTRLQQALALAVNIPGSESAAAKAALGLACLAYAQGEPARGRPLLQQSMEGFRRLRRLAGTAAYLSGLARFASFRGDYELAETLLGEALSLWREAAEDAEKPDAIEGDAVTSPVSQFPLSVSEDAKVRWEVADTIRRSGDVAYCKGNLPAANVKFEESLALFRDMHSMAGVAAAYTGLGVVARAQGNYDAARSHLNQAHQIRLRQEDWRGVVTSQRILADIACRQGRFRDARILLDELMETLRLHANFQGMTGALSTEGIVLLCEGNIPEAQARLLSALEMGNKHEDSRRVAYIRCFLALASLAAGDNAEATTHVIKSIRWFHEAGDQCGTPLALEVCAAVAAQRGDADRAAQLIGAAASLRDALGAPVPPAFIALFEPYLTSARAALGDEAFRNAQAQGASLSGAGVISLASLLAP